MPILLRGVAEVLQRARNGFPNACAMPRSADRDTTAQPREGPEDAMTPARERDIDPLSPAAGHRPDRGGLNVRLLSRLERTCALDGVIRAVEPAARRLVAREPVRRLLHGDSTGVPLHLIVRDLPYGAWFMAQFLDLFSDPGSMRAARRLVGLGVVTAVPTAATGWAEWALADRRVRRVGIVHAAVQGGAVLIFLGSWVARIQDRHVLAVRLARLGGLSLAVGGFLGGHMARGRRDGTTVPTRRVDFQSLADR